MKQFLVILLILPFALAQNPHFPVECTNDTFCDDQHSGSMCYEVTIETGELVQRCKCPDGLRPLDYTVPTGECVDYNPHFSTDCSGDATLCETQHPGSICDNDIEGGRCKCPPGFRPHNLTDYNTPQGHCVQLNTSFNVYCEGHEVCKVNHTGSICSAIPVVPPAQMCACPNGDWLTTEMETIGPDLAMYPIGACIFQAQLNDECELGISDCVVEHSECVYDGSNTGRRRCQCADGYKSYHPEDPTEPMQCGTILTKQLYELCEACEDNGGLCYSVDDDLLLADPTNSSAYDCYCPISRVTTEEDGPCGKLLVHVTCNIQDFTLHVCYEPHPDVNFTTGAVMFADGHGNDEACKGVPSTTESGCGPESERMLTLELKSDQINQCGVEEYRHLNKITFEKTIVVSSDDSMSDGYYFDVYCSVDTRTPSDFDAFGVRGVSGNDQGEHLEPTVDFAVFNELGNELTEGVLLRLGDKIRLHIELENDGTYAAAHVQHCTASTSPKIPDEDADTAVLVIDSCPAEGQTVFTADNIWKRVANQPNVLETGLLPSFKLPRGFDVFIHCSIKLCLSGSIEDCAPISCDDTMSAGKRKRRQATNENQESMDVTRKITYYEDETSGKVVMDQTGFALMITVLLIILIILTVLVVLFYLKLRGRGQQVDDIGAPPNKPQRFAMPRIGNAAMRM